MKTDCYITFNAKGVTGARKGSPKLRGGEFAVRLRLTIPDALFKPDMPTIDLTLPERAIVAPTVIVVEPPVASAETTKP